MKVQSIQVLDQVVLGVIGPIFVANVAFALRACFDKSGTHRASITKRYGAFWKTRLVLHSASALWMVSQGLKMKSLWQPAGRYLNPSFQHWAGDGTLCRIFLTLSLGLLEPFCIFMGILLCRGILSKKGVAELHQPNWKVLKAAAVTTAPFTAVYSSFAWMSDVKPDLAWEQGRGAGFSFLGTHRKGNLKECLGDRSQCIQCFIPAAFGIISVFVYLVALLLLFGGLQRRLNGAIDRRKIGTVFRITLTACLFCLLVLRSLMVIGGSPFKWPFQIFWGLNNLSIAFVQIVFLQFFSNLGRMV